MKTEIIEDTTPKHMDGVFPAFYMHTSGAVFLLPDKGRLAFCLHAGTPSAFKVAQYLSGDESAVIDLLPEYRRITAPITIRFTP